LISIYLHQNGSTQRVEQLDPAWLAAGDNTSVWVDLSQPTAEEARILSDTFHFHELAIEDAIAEIQHPKVESYGDHLYVVLHGIDFRARQHYFRTQDVDFFLGTRYLVTVHPGISRSIGKINELCPRDSRLLGEGPAALMHRIIDAMVDNYRPEVDKLDDRLDELEKDVFAGTKQHLARRILDFKRDVASLRRVVQPQRDVVGRLARREFPFISESLSYRYRDVYDHLVRLSEEATFLQDRVTSLLEAHLSAVSNQLNSVMKVLTVISTVFMPLTFITSLYGMNVTLPLFGVREPTFFWALFAAMLTISAVMLVFFRRRGWL
jgi:magnesium transporter